jgi:MFS family permease
MSNVSAATVTPPEPSIVQPRAHAWIWVHIVIAALAMAATLPGRTHGLGLITEPLLKDLHLGRVPYATINLWSTLLGAAFCVPCGWLIDRFGIRIVLTAISAALGAVVILMSHIDGVNVTFHLPGSTETTITVMIDLFVLVLLTRGLGQSALSVASLALLGQAAGRRAGFKVGVYSVLVSVSFMAAFTIIRQLETVRVQPPLAASVIGLVGSPMAEGQLLAISAFFAGKDQYWYVDWRTLWAGIGYGVLSFAALSFLLVRPRITGWSAAKTDAGVTEPSTGSLTLGQAFRTPTFWVFSLSSAVYLAIISGISLFNQSILAERQFDRGVFMIITNYSPFFGMVSNLATGWLATRWPLGRLLAVAMLIFTGALLAYSQVQTLWQVYAYAVALAVAGGMITLLFFAVWGQAFGPAHLSKIQGIAQMMTVFASGVGPELAARCKEETGDYILFFHIAAGVTALLTIAAWWTRLPSAAPRASDSGG